jgi:hypothetical protein
MDFFNSLLSSGLGGIVGLVGSWLTKREERLSQEARFKHEVQMAEIRKEEARFEAEHELAMAEKQIERASVEGDIAITKEEVSAFKESLKEQTLKYGGWVDALRGLMRPVITVYLLIIASIIAFKLNNLTGGLETLADDQQTKMLSIYEEVINQVLFLTATAVTWWFGSRPSSVRR